MSITAVITCNGEEINPQMSNKAFEDAFEKAFFNGVGMRILWGGFEDWKKKQAKEKENA